MTTMKKYLKSNNIIFTKNMMHYLLFNCSSFFFFTQQKINMMLYENKNIDIFEISENY